MIAIERLKMTFRLWNDSDKRIVVGELQILCNNHTIAHEFAIEWMLSEFKSVNRCCGCDGEDDSVEVVKIAMQRLTCSRASTEMYHLIFVNLSS